MPIGGAGDQQETVNAGMAAQPLVTSADPSVVGAGAVENLVNSFRNGSITMNDILDRVDNAAKSKRKALMQEMGEYVSPEAIQARQAQRSAVTAQAQLQAQQAHAQSQLLPSESQFAQAKLGKEQADLLNKQAIDQYLQYNPPIYKTDKEGNPTKEVDYDAVADAGRVYTRAGTLQQIAAQGLTPVGPPQIQTDDKGIKRAVTRNALREDISPGSDAFEYYHGLRQQALSVLMKPAAKSQTSGQSSSGLVQPAAPSAPSTPAPSMVMPTAGASTYPSVAGTTAPGEQIAPEPGTEPQQVAETARKDTPVTDWKSSMGIIRQFHNTVERYKLPGPTPQNDTTLANTVMQLSLKSGGGGARAAAGEYKVTNIEDAVPLMERLYNIKATLTKEHAFPPEVRARLIAIGQDNISAIEGNAAEVLRDVPQTQLLSHERSLVARYPVEGSAAAPSAAAPAAAAAAAGSAPAAAALPAWSASVPGLKPGMVGGVPSWVAPDGRHWPQ